MNVYNLIKEQRKSIQAPVDTLGASTIGSLAVGDTRKFQILVGLLFSSETKDTVTYAAIESLNQALGVLTPENVLKADVNLVHECICKIGFHKKKLEYLLEISRRLEGKPMPDTLESVLILPGIGRKMALLYIQHACGRCEGISVDTHVHRISNRIGLVKTTTAKKTGEELEKKFDRDEWEHVNRVLVGFGQEVCKAAKPKCDECRAKEICPYPAMPVKSKK